MVRKPAVAGQFYPGSEKELGRMIESCFKHPLGPGKIPDTSGTERNIKGLVVPHAGYMYSGPIAAHGYSALYEDGGPEVVVLVGPAHRGYAAGPASVDKRDYETPLGKVEVDRELVAKMAKEPIMVDELAHQGEHSLEVQIPFLQYLFEDIKIVPVLINKQDYETSRDVGKVIRDTIEGKDTVVIASTDFSHYVRKDVAEKTDRLAIDPILKNDPKGLYQAVRSNNISMCGYGPVIAMMVATEYQECKLLKYGTSGDISPMRDVVGYASLICR